MGFKNKFKSFFTVDDEYEYIEEEVPYEEEEPRQQYQKKDKQNIVNLATVKQPTSKVVLIEPRSYGEAQTIADNILNRRSVVINLERVDNHQAKRIVDFLSGTVYALNGDIQKLGTQTFLCTPDNVEISGTISDITVDEDDFGKGWKY
ncbi:cell division protein SepF [Ornithinibacillus sp. 4-3]|uniref:Cell division protein SepF n=1 Tax=Ornithinibacillus sp. 4-3 TaxID=3231488 RepID=A0AB39HNX1_9BACI